MATPAERTPVSLNEDIFYQFLDVVVLSMKLFESPLRSWEIDLLSVGRSIRLVCRAANTKLRPYTYPVLEILSTKQAAQLLYAGFPGRSSVRSLTIRVGVKPLYVSSILYLLEIDATGKNHHPNTFWSLKKFITDNRVSNAAPSSPRTPLQLTPFILQNVRDLAVIGCRDDSMDDFHYYLSWSVPCKIERLALCDEPLNDRHLCPNVRVVVARRLLTSLGSVLSYIDNLMARHDLLSKVTLVYSLEASADTSGAMFPTPQQKLGFVRKHDVTVVEVHTDVAEEEMEMWFADRVRNNTIWDLQGQDWLDLSSMTSSTG